MMPINSMRVLLLVPGSFSISPQFYDDITSTAVWQGANGETEGGIFDKIQVMHWIYLSPHFDDIALSCGGLVWEQAQRGEQVSIWTICGGAAPRGELSDFALSLHSRWGSGREAVVQRREEDLLSCRFLGAMVKHFSVPDCIYRVSPISGKYLYDSEAGIFGELHPDEAELVAWLREEFRGALPEKKQLICPLSLGGHVDHRLTRFAAESLGCRLVYYADYPYVLQREDQLPREQEGWQPLDFPVSEPGLAAWMRGVAAHNSQISTFWPDFDAMEQAIGWYASRNNGVRLWQRA